MSTPSFWILVCVALSIVLKSVVWRKRMKVLAIGCLVFFSNTFIFKEFTRMWEVPGMKIEEAGYYDVAIVLGGMAEYNNDLKRLSLRRGGDRMWQTIALYQRGKIGTILISGDSGYISDRGLNEAVRFRDELIAWGIPPSAILVDSLSKNTYQNAFESIKVLENNNLKDGKLLLVTSSIHMRRSIRCFEKLGVQVTPFSTDHYTGAKRYYHWDEYIIPSLSTMLDWHNLTHEWLGYLAYKLKGYC